MGDRSRRRTDAHLPHRIWNVICSSTQRFRLEPSAGTTNTRVWFVDWDTLSVGLRQSGRLLFRNTQIYRFRIASTSSTLTASRKSGSEPRHGCQPLEERIPQPDGESGAASPRTDSRRFFPQEGLGWRD